MFQVKLVFRLSLFPTQFNLSQPEDNNNLLDFLFMNSSFFLSCHCLIVIFRMRQIINLHVGSKQI